MEVIVPPFTSPSKISKSEYFSAKFAELMPNAFLNEIISPISKKYFENSIFSNLFLYSFKEKFNFISG